MTVVFPPPLDATLVIGLGLLALGAVGFVAAKRLTGSAGARLLLMARIPAVVVGIVLTTSAFFVATPPSHQAHTSPSPSTVESIAVGEQVYLNNCAACHGIDARGGGALAPTTEVPPPPLVGPGSHLAHHTDGDLHDIIANGLPGGMPAWDGTLTDDQIRHVINYLRSLQAAAAGQP